LSGLDLVSEKSVFVVVGFALQIFALSAMTQKNILLAIPTKQTNKGISWINLAAYSFH
jgi:hypothetical protein